MANLCGVIPRPSGEQRGERRGGAGHAAPVSRAGLCGRGGRRRRRRRAPVARTSSSVGSSRRRRRSRTVGEQNAAVEAAGRASAARACCPRHRRQQASWVMVAAIFNGGSNGVVGHVLAAPRRTRVRGHVAPQWQPEAATVDIGHLGMSKAMRGCVARRIPS